MTETFYDRLGVSADATTEEIEAAYREAIKRVHPDVSDDVDAGERTKRLNEAKRVLTDEAERARYDRLGHAAYTGERSQPDAADPGGSTDDGGRSPGRSTASGSRDHDWNGRSERRRTRDGSNRRRSSGRRATREGPGGTRRERADARGTAGHERRRGDVGGGDDSRDRRTTASDRRRTAGTTRSRADSTGPAWQTNSVGSATGASASGSGGGGAGANAASPSGARQVAAGETDGPNLEWSWNALESTGAWAVRQGADRGRSLRLSRLFPLDQSMVMLGSIFFLYPFFVGAALYPPFPLVARLAVAVCTLLTFAYLLSIPEAAIVIFGLWSVLVPLALLAFPGVGLFSLVGVVGLTATWVPLGLSVLTFSLVRP